MALVACIVLVPTAYAQGHGGGGHGGGMGGGAGFRDREAPITPPPGDGIRASGLHLAPPGRWWDNDRMVQTLGLNASQQKRMDDVFSENRTRMVGLYKDLDRELTKLDKLGRARNLDEGQIFAQIDRVNQVRGELEKATAHYQLQLRKEMTGDQTERMDEMRPEVRSNTRPDPQPEPSAPASISPPPPSTP